MVVYYFLSVFTLAFIYGAYVFYKRYRLKNAVERPFPEEWQSLLSTRLPIYSKMTKELKDDLHRKVQHFLYTKRFVGCEGLEITDEIRLVIASEACLLILNRPSSQYSKLRWIYIYPTTFVAKQHSRDEYGVVREGGGHLLGVSWSNGKVVLAWDSVERGIADFNDGENVVLHEFAHQLDQEDGAADGTPLLYTKDSYRIWSRVFSEEFDNLLRAARKGQSTLIDKYGATNPAEFFAVVTEAYFEKPKAMQREHPELFEALRDYYKNDPSDWQ